MAPPPWWCVPVPRRGVSQQAILTLENFLYEIVPRPNRARGRIVHCSRLLTDAETHVSSLLREPVRVNMEQLAKCSEG